VTERILIAGIGNIFLGDDAFGSETARQLTQRSVPEGVRVVDFGIRSFDLAQAIAGGYEAVILVDAMPRGEAPGTLYLIEASDGDLEAPGSVFNTHGMNALWALQFGRSLDNPPKRVFVLGCEPDVLECEDGQIGLTGKVQAAIPDAIAMIERLTADLLKTSDHNLVQRDS